MFPPIELSGRFLQNCAAIAINLAQIVTGITLGWSSPIFPLLISEDTPLADGPISVDEASRITAIFYLSGCVGSLVFGRLADYVGRKWAIILGVIPQICAYVIILVATNGTHLLISRALSGVSSNAQFSVIPMFLSEIAETKNRGRIGSYNGLTVTLGIAVGYAMGAYFHMRVGAIVSLVILGFFMATSIFFPETPQYLLMKKRDTAAFNSLMFYRGFRRKEDISDEFQKEYDQLKQSINNVMQRASLSCKDFQLRSTRKAILICFVMNVGRNFSGLFQLENFAGIVLDRAGAGIGGNESALASAAFVHVLSYVSMYLIEKVGRRWLMLVSSLGSAIFLAILSIMIMLNDSEVDISAVNWIPTLAYAGYSAIAIYGIIVVPVIIATEILPIKIRSLILLILLIMSNLLTTVSVNWFMAIADFLGFHSNIWIFSGSCFIEFVVLYFLLPETKGKTYDEIVKLLN
ncbi:facilitated trehalose transporter Tret1-like [Lutzomyia longipalpis]|uniref:facilitated trehalose transporter Tret1-like n=1 Tax=Lutzomyia longipalpis TaxID=7200 RepID=UPI002483CF0C|nr:facilitated trehalose transporter Tret1-like [Lutzomyia longipalpis]